MTKRKYVRRTPKPMPTTAASLSETPTDAELGIGEEDDVSDADQLSELLANPLLAKLIDAAVAQRLGQMQAPAGVSLDASAFADLAATLKHMVQVNAVQQPGYIKPLPVEEVDRRAAAHVEMWALIKRYEEMALAPAYVVGEGGFFECSNALEFREGDKIRTFLPPAEDFIPDNEPAAKIHAAFMRSIGGSTPEIGEQVRQAQINAKLPPLVTGVAETAAKRGPVELVERPDAPTMAARPRRRSMGSIVPERREVSMAESLGGAPVGPAFAEAAS